MASKGGKIALLVLWGIVGVALIIFVGFINDKPKIAQENQQYAQGSDSISQIKNFLDSSQKVISNSPIKLPK